MLLRAPSIGATRAIAAELAALARVGDIVVLGGGMGAGKTAFAQGFGAALGIAEPITSPTFTLVHSYPIDTRRTLHHADIYRLDSYSAVDELGLHELADAGIVLVEWGDVAAALWGDHLEVVLRPDDEIVADDPDGAPADDVRVLEVTAIGARWQGRWERVTSALAGWAC